jgi:hypothetical protein
VISAKSDPCPMQKPALPLRGQDREPASGSNSEMRLHQDCFGKPGGCSKRAFLESDTVDEKNESPWKDRAAGLGNEHDRYGFRRGSRP